MVPQPRRAPGFAASFIVSSLARQCRFERPGDKVFQNGNQLAKDFKTTLSLASGNRRDLPAFLAGLSRLFVSQVIKSFETVISLQKISKTTLSLAS